MVRLLLLCSLLLPIPLIASAVYQSNDKYGRPVFSDTPNKNGKHQLLEIQIQNDYDWHNPELTLRKARKLKKKKRRKKKKKSYSFAELQSKCAQSRYRYQHFRGSNTASDWGSYKSKIIKYAQKRDYWCSRALKRK